MIRGLLSLIINLLIILILVHAIGSWIPKVRESRFYETLDRLVSPLLDPVRKVIPPQAGIDFSPMIVLLLLYLIKHMLRL